jgi:transposase
MRKIKEVLRLHFDSGLAQRPISRCTGISRTTVGDYLDRAKKEGLDWPLPEALTDQELERRLFPPVRSIPSADRLVPD